MISKILDVLLEKASAVGASDIHLAVGKPPLMRVDGIILPIGIDPKAKRDAALEAEIPLLTPTDIEQMVRSILKAPQVERFEREREIDLSYQITGGMRFRVNCHFEREHMGFVARVIPDVIPSMEDIHMPIVVRELIHLDRGIVLATGPTGSGKSTTLASMIEEINKERPLHIVTLEDPVEFMYHAKRALIRQRQFGTDFLSFGEAMRRVLRQDPDVILVGEMRDLETIAAALTLAETGHLVFGTLHTNNAAQTVDRIIDVFPPHQQSQIRTQLSMTLRAVIAQRLVPRKDGGRVAVREVLLNSPAVANIIRDNRVAELQNVIQTSAQEGMITVDRDIARLISEGVLERETGEEFAEDPESLKKVKVTKKKGSVGWFG
ncbi:MAG TPA: PilT/PilU family type 4a pilus ATPase [Candidatus Peribacterales bacterium]|nr:PilT/PilU family type 4a pilus ATPase [Candidatus Peribacterales bacterium]